MLTFHHTCIGASHLTSGKPCQDASFSGTIGNLHIAIVSDGHGGERYVRSEWGARFAVDAAHEIILQSALMPWQDPSERLLYIEELVSLWKLKVMSHYMSHPLSPTEQSIIYRSLAIEHILSTQEIYTLYGCTLMAACIHEDGWFAFQIGDGKCVTVHPTPSYTNLNNPTPSYTTLTSEPVPDDERCFLNMTTSLCEAFAESSFRYAGGDKDSIPSAIFLGTDGIDTSWGSRELLHDFYLEILKHCSSRETILQELQEVLPKLSKKGSHDDMSIAALVRDEVLPDLISIIFQYQIAECERIKKRQEIRLVGCQEAIALKQAELAERPNDEFLQRDLSNLQNHLSQVNQLLARSTSRLARLQQQFQEYQQQTGKYNIKTSS